MYVWWRGIDTEKKVDEEDRPVNGCFGEEKGRNMKNTGVKNIGVSGMVMAVTMQEKLPEYAVRNSLLPLHIGVAKKSEG